MGTIYHNNNSYGKSIDSPASDIILSSVMHIGGETQDNAEDAIVALSASGGSGDNLEDLSDVSVGSPIEGDYLEYDGIANIWISHVGSKIVTWADGTDEEIAAMLDLHYQNVIDITDYWSVGDERIVHLRPMSATYVGESHASQDVKLVLMNEGGKYFTTSINKHSQCAFIVGQKDCLNEVGYMNSSNTTGGGWENCSRRTWCNSVYKNALPSTLVGIFKQHQNRTADGSTSVTIVTSIDYFALPSEKEVFGSVKYANATAEASNTQFKYYETSSNRIKTVNGSASRWWGRPPYDGQNDMFCQVANTGVTSAAQASGNFGIAPFGVI